MAHAWRGAVVLAGIAAGATVASAQEGGVRITRGGRQEIEMDPGTVVTLVYRVVNPTVSAHAIKTALRPPKGWHAVYEEARDTLRPSESRLELASLASPPNAAPGSYAVLFDLRVDDSKLLTDSSVVFVRERRKISVVNRSAPPVALAGDTVQMTFVVKNDGNASSDVQVKTRSALGYLLRQSWLSGALAAGESRSLAVTLRVPRDAVRSASEFISVWAEGPDSTRSTELVVPVQVVALGLSTGISRPEVPGVLTIRSGTGRAPGFGSYVSGGAISKDGRNRLDVTLLSAETQSTLYRERDQYRAELRLGESSVELGDQVWSLSPLTEVGHYGLGIGGHLAAGPVLLGGFLDNGPRDQPGRKQVAAFTGMRWGRGPRAASLTVQYIAWSDTTPGSIWSVRGQSPLFPGSRIDAEVARGFSDSTRTTTTSSRVGVSGGWSRLAFSLQHTHSDSAFPVRGRPALSDNGSLSFNPVPHVWIDGSLNTERTAFEALLGPGIPNQRRFTNVGISISRFVRLEGRQEGFVSPGQPWSSGWRTESARGSLTIPLGIATLTPQYQVGRASQPNDTVFTPFTLATLELAFRFGSNQQLSVRVDQTQGVAGNPGLRTTFVSLNAGIAFPSHTRLELMATNIGSPSMAAPWYAGSRRWDVSVSQELFFGHRLVARYGTFLSPAIPGAPPPVKAFRIDYGIPIGIPIGSAPDGGRMLVEVLDADSGTPVSGLLLRVGTRSVMTDRLGRARVSSLAEGDHWLTVDSHSLGAVRLTVPSLPLRVTVRPHDESLVRLRLTRSVRILGRVVRLDRPTGTGDSTLVEAGGVRGATIEATHGEERYYATTDASGRFEISRLVPGNWRVRVSSMDALPFYELAQPFVDLSIKPGDQASVALRVVPKTKSIRFDQGGEIRDRPAKHGIPKAELPPAKRMKGR